jgi:acetyltransferase-like isoleucine patch superfamily enzyme
MTEEEGFFMITKYDPRFMNKNQSNLYAHYEIGDFTYGVPKVFSWDEGATLKIGRFCSIARGVEIYLGGEHRTDWVTTYPFNALFPDHSGIKGHPKTKGDVVIGNDVWIADGAIIMSGVTIGDGAVIGARSVVIKDVKPYEIVAGNPAVHIKFRFDEKVIQKLLEIKWWNWETSKIDKSVHLLQNDDINGFINAYKEGDAKNR